MKSANALIRISYETHIACKTKALPVDPLVLADRLHLRMKRAEKQCEYWEVMGSDASMLVHESGDYVIYLKPESGDIRLPAIHEISHYLLRHVHDEPEEEGEADLLAMFHLAPPVILRIYRGDRLRFISEITGVSEGEARRYLSVLARIGRAECKTRMDGTILTQFEDYLRKNPRCFRVRAPFLEKTGKLFSQIAKQCGMLFDRYGLGHPVTPQGVSGIGPEARPARQDRPELLSPLVYITPAGTKYHGNPNCAGANAVAVDLEKAVALKRTPCSRCVF